MSSEQRAFEDPGQRGEGSDTCKEKGLFLLRGAHPSRYGCKKRQATATLTVNTDGIYVFWSLNISPLCDAVALPRCT